MISVSTRAAVPLSIAIALLAIPITYHGWVEPMSSGCANPAASFGAPVLPDVNREEVESSDFGGLVSETKGTLALPGTWKVQPRFRMTQTFDLGRYYFVPIGTFTHPFPGDTIETLQVEVDGIELPLHLRLDETYESAVQSIYFYLLGGRPIRNTFFGALAEALPQLFRGSFPLTMILVQGNSEFVEAATNRATLIDWAERAWTRFNENCSRASQATTTADLTASLRDRSR